MMNLQLRGFSSLILLGQLLKSDQRKATAKLNRVQGYTIHWSNDIQIWDAFSMNTETRSSQVMVHTTCMVLGLSPRETLICFLYYIMLYCISQRKPVCDRDMKNSDLIAQKSSPNFSMVVLDSALTE